MSDTDSLADNTEPQKVKIGARIRHARLSKGLVLKQVAQNVGCTESFLSKLENDKVYPSLSLLHRLVKALGINISSLFSDDTVFNQDIFIFRQENRSLISTKAGKRSRGVTLEHLIPLLPNPLLQATIHNIEPGGGSQGLMVHTGEEMGYVLQGSLQLTTGKTVHVVEEGDSFFFLSEVPHGYINKGKITARVLWVNTPPTF